MSNNKTVEKEILFLDKSIIVFPFVVFEANIIISAYRIELKWDNLAPISITAQISSGILVGNLKYVAKVESGAVIETQTYDVKVGYLAYYTK